MTKCESKAKSTFISSGVQTLLLKSELAVQNKSIKYEKWTQLEMENLSWEKIFLKEAVKWIIGEGDLSEVSQYVVVGLGGGLDELLGRLKNRRLVGKSVYTGSYKGCKISVSSRFPGPMGIESFIRVLGLRKAKTVIGVGWCGSLIRQINIGDLVIPLASAREENLTDYYAPKEMPAIANSDVLFALIRTAKGLGYDPSIGPIVSTAMMMKETEELIKKWNKLSLLAVESECSTLFLLSHLEEIKAGAILAVRDSPIEKKAPIMYKTLDRKQREAFGKATTVAFEAMVKLSKTEEKAQIKN